MSIASAHSFSGSCPGGLQAEVVPPFLDGGATSQQPPVLVAADEAAHLCGVSLRTWRRFESEGHSRHHEIFKTVQWSVLKRKQLTGQYESPYESKPVTLKLHPYRLCLVKNAWYVIGRPMDEKEPRTYRVARFKTLRMLDQPADVPDDFDLRQYFGNAWAVYRGEKTYDIENLVHPRSRQDRH